MINRTHIPIPRSVKKEKVKKRIRKRAKRHVDADKLYSKLNKAYKKANPFCQFCLPPDNHQMDMYECTAKTKDVHHMAGRGPYLNDTTLWMPVCRSHHKWIHDNPKRAEELGFIVRRPPPPKPHEEKYLT